MGSQRISSDDFAVEESLMDLISISSTGKIKRPPNAFMLFARDHRKNLATQNPDFSNKGISSLLGEMWRDTPIAVKNEYLRKAKLVDDMHKRLYPGYSYCPIVARLKKNEKKKKRKVEFSKILKENKTKKETVKIVEQDNTVSRSRIPTPSSAYIPNNPEYLNHSSPELHIVNEDEGSSIDCASRSQPTFSTSGNDMESERQNESESVARNVRSSIRREDPTQFLGDIQYSYPVYPACFDMREHNPSTMNPFYYRPTQTFPHLRGSYWSPAQAASHPLYHQAWDDKHDNTKQYISTAPHSLNCYRPHMEHSFHNRTNFPYYKVPGFVQYPEFNTDKFNTSSKSTEYDFTVTNPETSGCFSKSTVKGRLSSPFQEIYSYEDQLRAQNRVLLKPNNQTTGYFPSFIQPEPKETMPNCFPQNYSYENPSHAQNRVVLEPSNQTARYVFNFIQPEARKTMSNCSSPVPPVSEVIRNDPENIFYDKSIAGEDVIRGSHPDLNSNNSMEVSAEKDSPCFRESGSPTSQIPHYFHLRSKECSRMQSLVSQPRQGYFEIYKKALPLDSEMFGVNKQPATGSFRRFYNLGPGEETKSSDLNLPIKSDTLSTRNHEAEDSLETDGQFNRTFNYYRVSPEDYDDRTNNAHNQKTPPEVIAVKNEHA